jgi:hypothetical protein
MPQLIVKNVGMPGEKFSLARLRTTIGRSARSDVCIPDAFASRLHAEVRKEGDAYWLQDLGSANGTRYNGQLVTMPIPLLSGGEIHRRNTHCIRRRTGQPARQRHPDRRQYRSAGSFEDDRILTPKESDDGNTGCAILDAHRTSRTDQ